MSNYAPDPGKEEIYNNLQNKTLSSVSAEDIQKLTDPTFIQSTNQDALISYNIVNEAAMRNGLPIPNSSAIQIKTITDNSTQEIFRPSIGEVWQLMGASFARTAGDGSSVYTLYLNDEDNNLVYWFYASSSDQNVSFSADGNFPDMPMYFDNNVFLAGAASNGASGGGIGGSWKIAVVRVR
tara:strand:+ start:179 stop:721 length:543 start_codon:yes stop_codon:yes gene_type:complete